MGHSSYKSHISNISETNLCYWLKGTTEARAFIIFHQISRKEKQYSLNVRYEKFGFIMQLNCKEQSLSKPSEIRGS